MLVAPQHSPQYAGKHVVTLLISIAFSNTPSLPLTRFDFCAIIGLSFRDFIVINALQQYCFCC